MNPLNEILPAKARKVTYAVLFLLALGFSVWKASNGDWVEFTSGLITALVNLMAASNTPAPEVVEGEVLNDGAH